MGTTKGSGLKSLQRLRLHLSITFIAVVIGFLLVTQLKMVTDIRVQLSDSTPEELALVISDLSRERDQLSQEILEIEGRLGEARSQEQNIRAVMISAEEAQSALKITTGQGRVEGPGVSIVLIDPLEQVTAYDLLLLVRELMISGVEALAINDKRFVAGVEFRQIDGIWLANTPISSPYRVEVIGEPGTIEQALGIRGGITDSLALLDEVSITVNEVPLLELPAAGLPKWRYSQILTNNDEGSEEDAE